MAEPEQRTAVTAFLTAALRAIPRARKTGMNAHVPPVYALGLCRREASPVQLVNAFESPVRANGDGYVTGSVREMLRQWDSMREVWELKFDEIVATGCYKPEQCEDSPKVPEQLPVSQFLGRLVNAAFSA
jgi:hypothetical protein